MIIDTMVFAYTLLGVEGFREQASEALAAADIIQVPESLRAELLNVVWKWVNTKNLSLDLGAGSVTGCRGSDRPGDFY